MTRSEHPPFQNLPIPLTPEQRERSRKLKAQLFDKLGFRIRRLPIDYAKPEYHIWQQRVYDGSGGTLLVDCLPQGETKMGMHSDAIALAARCGKSVQDCKRAMKEKNADITEALRNSAGRDRIDVMATLLYGGATPASKPITAPPPPPPPIEKAIDPKPEPQVMEPVIEKQVVETHDEDSMGVGLKDDDTTKVVKKAKAKKKKSKRNPKQG